MNIQSILRKIAIFIISYPRHKVTINIENVNWNNSLKGRKIIITGGTRGIGLALAKKFISEGAHVVITGRNQLRLENALKELGENASGLYYDSNNIDQDSTFLNNASKIMGGVDTLVLNAGISMHEGNILNVSQSGYDTQFNTNLKSNYFLAQSFLKMMLSQNIHGNLLFLSSETSAKKNDIPYGLTKVAINSLVGGIARRVGQRGIRCNAIAPGVTYTDMTKNNKINSDPDDYSYNSAAERFLLVDEIANVACFLLSKGSSCINGEVIFCDAGNHLKINGTDSEYSL